MAKVGVVTLIWPAFPAFTVVVFLEATLNRPLLASLLKGLTGTPLGDLPEMETGPVAYTVKLPPLPGEVPPLLLVIWPPFTRVSVPIGRFDVPTFTGPALPPPTVLVLMKP